MQTLFKSNLFSSSSSKMGAKNFLSGGKKLGSSIVGAAKNNIVGFNRTAQAMMPQKKEEKENNFISNYTNFFGAKKTERILRKNLKLVRDSLVNTFEIARNLKAAIISITGSLKGKGGMGGGGGFFGKLAFLTSIVSLLLNPAVLTILGVLAVGGIAALLMNEKTRDAIFGFFQYHLPKFIDFLTPHIKTIVKAMLPMIPEWMYKNETTMEVQARVNEVGVEQTLAELKEELNSKRFNIGARLSGEINELKNQIFMLEQGEEKSYGVKGFDAMFGVPGMNEEIRLKKIEIRTQREKSPENDKTKRYNDDTNAIIKEEVKKIKAKWKALGDEDQRNKLPRRDKHMILRDAELAKEQQEKRIKLAQEGNPAYQMYLPKNKDTKAEVKGVQSDLNTISFADSLKMTEGGSMFNFEPITFDASTLNQGGSGGGEVTSTSNGGTTGGDSVTFYSSSSSDPSYHKLNAQMTFNIV